ncbi:hypothetical protein [Allosphingosinicella vermicomposti]|uniref:hypothetical protein n=1 Tax=Allosphingosinicella vermicomposti TaxID=614671 RepID=UPI000D0F8F53|nr:hypothetical protein [Allosphingosinicella vermicomposti]
MMPILRDASAELLRAIRKRAGCAVMTIEELSSRPWASATFSGARHKLALRLDGVDAEEVATRFAAGIEAAEFALRGHIVADIAVVGADNLDGSAVRLRVEALTVEDA